MCARMNEHAKNVQTRVMMVLLTVREHSAEVINFDFQQKYGSKHSFTKYEQ